MTHGQTSRQTDIQTANYLYYKFHRLQAAAEVTKTSWSLQDWHNISPRY